MTQERESRMWWVQDEGRVVHVRGYSCAPDNPEYWWIPEIGCSTPRVHAEKAPAVAAAKAWLQNKIARLQGQLTALEAR